MDITCENCQSKFRIPDNKIPPGKTAVLNCPKCKNKMSVTAAPKAAETAEDEIKDGIYDEVASGAYDASEKPFDFVEEEGKTALVCESDPEIKKALTDALDLMEYHTTDAENIRDALTKMRYHTYDLILVRDSFDSSNPDENGVLVYLERLPMTIRRNIFVALISDRFRTMDNMMAFNKSVNIIINTDNVSDSEKIIQRGITDNDLFFRVYKETLKKIGRI